MGTVATCWFFCQKLLILSLIQVILFLLIEHLKGGNRSSIKLCFVGAPTPTFFIYSAIISLLICICKPNAKLFFYMV